MSYLHSLLLYCEQRLLHNVNLYFEDVRRLPVNYLLVVFYTISYVNVWIHPSIYCIIVSSRARDIFTKIRPFTTSLTLTGLGLEISGFSQE